MINLVMKVICWGLGRYIMNVVFAGFPSTGRYLQVGLGTNLFMLFGCIFAWQAVCGCWRQVNPSGASLNQVSVSTHSLVGLIIRGSGIYIALFLLPKKKKLFIPSPFLLCFWSCIL